MCPFCLQPVTSVQGLGELYQRYIIECSRCGRYIVSDYIADNIRDNDQLFENSRHLISAAARRSFERAKRLKRGVNALLVITEDNCKNIINAIKPQPGVVPIADDFLIYLSEFLEGFNSYYPLVSGTDYPLALCRDQGELVRLMEHLRAKGYLLEKQSRTFTEGSDLTTKLEFRITAEGYERIRDTVKSRKKTEAFVAMWFDPKETILQAAYEAAMKKAIEDATILKVVRADKAEHNDDINDWILGHIRQSAFMIADFTGNRGGVYLEAGYAMGLGIPVIFTCEDKKEHIEKLHFDTNHRNHIFWKDSEHLYNKLIDRIGATIPMEYLR